MVDTKRGYVGRYEERFAQQESAWRGVVKEQYDCMYVSGRLLYKVCMDCTTHAIEAEETCLCYVRTIVGGNKSLDND